MTVVTVILGRLQTMKLPGRWAMFLWLSGAAGVGAAEPDWPQFRGPITDAWTGYLDHRWGWDSACDRLVDAIDHP